VTARKQSIVTATPSNASTIAFFGGTYQDGVQFTTDQNKALYNYYGFDEQIDIDGAQEARDELYKYHQKLVAEWEVGKQEHTRYYEYEDRHKKPVWQEPESVLPLLQAGAQVNLMCAVKHDGMRVMAFLSQFLENEDPVQLVEQLCIDAGYDCEYNNWIYDDFDDEGDKE